MKKSKLAAAILCIISTCLLCACQPKQAPPDTHGLNPNKPVQITIWNYYNGAQKTAFDALIAEFNQTTGAEQGIVVESSSHGGVEELTNSIKDSADKKVGSAAMPSIFAAYVDVARDIDERDMLASFDPYLTKEEIDTYIPNYIEEGRFDMKHNLKVLPIAKSTEVLMVNQTAWNTFSKETGVTTDDLSTWEGLAKTAQTYYNWSNGKAFFNRDAFANYMLVGSMQLGKEIFPVENGQVTLQLDRDTMRKLWDNLYVPYVKGYYTSIGRFASDDMKTGDIIALVGSSSASAYFPSEVTIGDKAPSPIDCLVLPVPNFEGTKPYAVQQGAGMAITKSDETHEYASVVFLKWFTEASRNTIFSLNSGYMPVKKEANDEAYMQQIVEKEKIKLIPVVSDTLKTAMKEANTYTLYTSQAFQNGNDARRVLESSMITAAKEDRASIIKKIQKGTKENKALEPYLSDNHFEDWYQTLNQTLSDVISK